jgi:hypothetical protein
MAALDRNLKRAERIAGLLPSGRRRRRAETAEPDTAAA